jgi:hypothetical protein
MTLWNLVRIGLVLVVGGLIYTHQSGHRWSDAVTAIPRAGELVSSRTAATTCNPTKLDAVATRYTERVERAMQQGRATDVDVTEWASRQYASASRSRERDLDAVIRAIDASHPGDFPFATSFGELRIGAALEARGLREMRRAVLEQSDSRLRAGEALVARGRAHYHAAEAALGRLKSAPPCA